MEASARVCATVCVCVCVPVPMIQSAIEHTVGYYMTGCGWVEGPDHIDPPLDR